jgi:hypothetical protein
MLDGHNRLSEKFAKKKYLAPAEVLTRMVYPVAESLQRLKFSD